MHNTRPHRNIQVRNCDVDNIRRYDRFSLTVGDIVVLNGNNDDRHRHEVVITEIPPLLLNSINSDDSYVGNETDLDEIVRRFFFITVTYDNSAYVTPLTDNTILSFHPLAEGFVVNLDERRQDFSTNNDQTYSESSSRFQSISETLEYQSYRQIRELHSLLEAQGHSVFKTFWNLQRKQWFRTAILIDIMAEFLVMRECKGDIRYTNRMLIRAAHYLVGRHGILRGWASELPDIWGIFYDQTAKTFKYPVDWCYYSNSDGDSSYRSDSPGCCKANRGSACSSSDDSGLRGATSGKRRYVTGFSSTSESSTNWKSDSEYDFMSTNMMVMSGLKDRMDIFGRQWTNNDDSRRYAKKFSRYMIRANNERRQRRSIRRARRWARAHFNEDRRRAEPMYDVQAKRAEMLASVKTLKSIHANRDISSEDVSQTSSDSSSEDEEPMFYSQLSNGVTINRNKCTEDRKRQNERVCALARQLEMKLYEKLLKFHKERNLTQDPEMSFRCAITPVRWVKQTGANCGLVALAMAARPLLLCEVMESGEKQINDAARNALLRATKMAENVIRFSKTGKVWPSVVDPPTLAHLQEEAIRAGFSSRGEMFSARDMARLANKQLTGKYCVKIVDRSLLAPTQIRQENTNNPKMGKITKKEKMNIDSDYDNLTIQPDDPLWTLNIVQRLFRGQLISVCYDCDRDMRPTSENGGRTAHWTLLCGVIISTPRFEHDGNDIDAYNDTECDGGCSEDVNKFNGNEDECCNTNEESNKVSNEDPIYPKRLKFMYQYNPIHRDFEPVGHTYSEETEYENHGNDNSDSEYNYSSEDDSESYDESYCDSSTDSSDDEDDFNHKQLETLDLNLENVWVVARNGKNGDQLSVWLLKDLADSNLQLRMPDDEILETIPINMRNQWGLYNEKDIDAIRMTEKSAMAVARQLKQENRDAYRWDNRRVCSLLTNAYNTSLTFDDLKKLLPLHMAKSWWPCVQLINNAPIDKFKNDHKLKTELPLINSVNMCNSSAISSTLWVPPERSNRELIPYVLSEGSRLDLCLANQYLSFEPVRPPNYFKKCLREHKPKISLRNVSGKNKVKST